MDLDGLFQFHEDVVEAASLDASRGRSGVAVHGVAHEEDLSARRADRVDQRWKMFGHLLGTVSMDERQASWFIIGMKRVDQRRYERLELRGFDAGTDLDGDRIPKSPHEFHMRAVGGSRSHADPGEVGREVVPAVTTGNHPRQGRFVFKQQRLMARVELDA